MSSMESSDITDLYGVGTKTAEVLEDNHGLSTLTDVARAFLTTPATDLERDFRDSEENLPLLIEQGISAFSESEFDSELPVENILYTMGFVRSFPPSRSRLVSEFSSVGTHVDPLSVGVTDVDWSVGFITDLTNTLSVIYDDEAAQETLNFDYTLIDTTPDELLIGETGTKILVSENRNQSLVNEDFLELIESITGVDYTTNPEYLRMRDVDDAWPILAVVPGTSVKFLIAPLTK